MDSSKKICIFIGVLVQNKELRTMFVDTISQKNIIKIYG